MVGLILQTFSFHDSRIFRIARRQEALLFIAQPLCKKHGGEYVGQDRRRYAGTFWSLALPQDDGH